MNGTEVIAAVGLLVRLAEFIPGIVQSFEEMVELIRSHGELSDVQKANLISDLDETAMRVAAYKPRPPG